MDKYKTITFNALMNVEEYWSCEMKVPADIVENEDKIKKYIGDNPQEIDWQCVRESYPGDIVYIDEIEIEMEE